MREITDTEKNTIKEDMMNALWRDGEGKDYHRDFGRYLWQPKPDTFKRVTAGQSGIRMKRGKIVFTMQSTEQQVTAIWIGEAVDSGLRGQVYVCHNGQERDRTYREMIR